MIAKALLLFCLVAAGNTYILKKLVGYPTPIVAYRHLPEVHEFVAQPLIHKVVHPIHVENVIQPFVHTVYKTPLLHHSVESPVLEPQPAVIPDGVPLASPIVIKKK